eukprot:773837-Pelagomonas_calceolata.AAC.1
MRGILGAHLHEEEGQPCSHKAAPLAHALRKAVARRAGSGGGEVGDQGVAGGSLHASKCAKHTVLKCTF